jgi:hypothetical protein
MDQMTSQILLLVIGTLLSVLSTVSIVRSGEVRKSIDRLAEKLQEFGTKLTDHMLDVGKNYMTHEQHERHHRSHKEE